MTDIRSTTAHMRKWVKRTGSRSAWHVGFASAAVFVVGCSDLAPTTPRISVTGAAPPSLTKAPADPLARFLPTKPGACVIMTRNSMGRYATAHANLSLPPSLLTSKASPMRIGYRGWSEGVETPTRLAVCSYPDVAGAREYVSTMLGAAMMNAPQLKSFASHLRVANVSTWGRGTSPHLMQGAARIDIVDGRAAAFPRILSASRALSGEPTMTAQVICDDPQPGCDNYGDPPSDPPPGGGGGSPCSGSAETDL